VHEEIFPDQSRFFGLDGDETDGGATSGNSASGVPLDGEPLS
jgi:hypothetical protein